MRVVDAAMLTALEAHGTQTNKHDGELYALHLARVWINASERGGTKVQQAIAWLHDSVEDTPLTLQSLQFLLIDRIDLPHGGVIDAIVAGVDGMTKRNGETLEEYYRRCKDNPDSRFVKLHCDIVDNFRRNYLIADDEKRLKMAYKYSMGVDILT